MNKEKKIEEFLKKLPKNSVTKIKGLKFQQNLVLINRHLNHLEEVETGKIVKKSDWDFTIPEIAKTLHVSRTWVYKNIQSKVRYIYINNFDLNSLSIFYQKNFKELSEYRELVSVHLNTKDVINWFNDSFQYGKRSVVINSQRIFGDKFNQILLAYAVNSINHLSLDMHDLDKYVLNTKLWDLCLNAPFLYHTSKYPLVKLPKTLTATELKNTTFHVLSEYKYAANGMHELLISGASVYKGKKGKNSKMLFVFCNNDPFDVDRLYKELSERIKGKNYSPRIIEEAVTTLESMFVVPASEYCKEFPIS